MRCHNCLKLVELPNLRYSKTYISKLIKELASTICPKCGKLVYSKKLMEQEMDDAND